MGGDIVIGVKSIQNTYPCSAPVLSLRVDERQRTNLTDLAWSFKKSLIQGQVGCESPRSVSLGDGG